MKYIVLAQAPGTLEWERVEVHDSEQAALDAIEALEAQSSGPWQFRVEEALALV